MRPLEELTAVDDPAWPWLQRVLADAAVPVTVLPVDQALGAQTLLRMQVTAASALGALALHTGGVVVAHGWVRMLGGGAPGLPDLATANRLGGRATPPPGHLLVAWEPMGLGHSGFVQWVVSHGLDRFSADLRWPGWEDEVAELPIDHGISAYPPVYSAQGTDVAAESRRGVPMTELLAHLDDVAQQLGGRRDGSAFRVTAEDAGNDGF